MDVPVTAISFILGAFIVWMFCLRYFNEPKYPLSFDQKEGDRLFDIGPEPALPKLLTYRYRYNFYLWLFILTVEALYLVISFYLPQFSGEPGKEMDPGYSAIVAALIITGVLPNLSFIKALLEKVRLFFHERAKTPAKGQELYRILRSHNINYADEKVRQLVEHAEWNLVCPDSARPPAAILTASDFTAQVINPVRAKWAKLTYLLFVVETWSDRGPWKYYIGHKELGWAGIKEMHRNVKHKVFEDTRAIEDFNNDIEILLLRTYRMIACLLFMADRSCTKLNVCLGELGYPPCYPTIFGIPFRQLALAAISTGAGILVGAVVAILISMILRAKGMFPMVQITTTQIMMWTIYGIPFLMAPTFLVLLLKRYLSTFEVGWPMVTPQNEIYRKFRERPWHIYLFVSLGGYLAAFAVLVFLNAVFGMLTHQESSSSIGALSRLSIWAFLGMVTAGFVAFRIDSRSNGHRKAWAKVVLTTCGCLLQAAATMAVIFFAFMHANNHGRLTPYTLVDKDLTRLFIYLIMGMCIGTALFLSSRFNTADLDRRTGRRKKVNKVAALIVGGETIDGVLRNYSREGALVSVAHMPPTQAENEPIQVKIKNAQPVVAKIVRMADGDVHLRFVAEEREAA